MEIVLLILAFILLLLGLIGSFLPVIPGPPLSFIGLLLIKFSGYGEFTSVFLLVWAGITVAITVMDYILPAILAKKFGGSKYAAIGSIVGIIAGLFFAPLGIIVGPFLGAFIGELVHNKNDKEKALKVGFGAFLAFIVGTGGKLIVCSLMLFFSISAVIKYFQGGF